MHHHHNNNNNVEHLFNPANHLPFPEWGEGGGGHFGEGCLKELALFGLPPWGGHLLQQPLCPFAVGSGSLPEPALLLPEASTPCLFPPHVYRTRCSVPSNSLTSSSNFPLGTLT